MQCLERNKSVFYYATYIGRTEIIDDQGFSTGEYQNTYSNPVLCRGNVSAAKGEVNIQQFGESEIYDKVIVLNETDITSSSVLWVDTLPVLDNQGATTTPYDYVVKKIARSLNSVSIAISKVNVRE